MLLSNWLSLINSQVSAKTNTDFPLRPKNTLCYKLNIWSHSSHDNEIEKQKEREGRSKGGRKGGKGKGREREKRRKRREGKREQKERMRRVEKERIIIQQPLTIYFTLLIHCYLPVRLYSPFNLYRRNESVFMWKDKSMCLQLWLSMSICYKFTFAFKVLWITIRVIKYIVVSMNLKSPYPSITLCPLLCFLDVWGLGKSDTTPTAWPLGDSIIIK